MTFVEAAIGAALLVVGYLAGRWRLGAWLMDWTEDAITPGWRSWQFWPAAPIAVAILAGVWIAHPRRTLDRVRAAREDQRAPALELDPNRAANRHATEPEET